MANLFGRLRDAITNKPSFTNKFNEAFFKFLGSGYTQYDKDSKNYIEKGYNINPLVYAPINQMSTKTASIPYAIKKVEDKKAFNKRNKIKSSTNMEMSIQQKVRYLALETKAFDDDDLEFPLERPNPNQSWTEFISLYKTFIRLTGNVYWYDVMPENGVNAGKPIASYLLPSHLMQIIVKNNASMTDVLGSEDVVRGYILTEGDQFIEFKNSEVIHIKYPNPNYDLQGGHLYGMSPLRSALKNIQSSNTGLDLSIKTQLNGGAFGFIHGKQTPLTEQQAKELRDRMKEMDASPERMAKIAGFSAEVGFTRISLTSDELKPFDYLDFDENKIANVLDWQRIDDNKSDFGGTINEIRKMRVVDNIMPDLDLLTDKINTEWLPKFKGYENTVIEFDVMELPEMQDDLGEMGKWLDSALDRGVINRNEYRTAIRYIESEDANMDVHTVSSDVYSLEEAISNDFNVGNGNTQ